MRPADFSWTLSPERAWLRMSLEGELDLSTAAAFTAAVCELMDNGCNHILVDLSELAFMDSSGLRATFELDAEASRRGIGLRLIGANNEVQRLFSLTGLSRRLEVAPGTNGHVAER